MEEFPPTGWKEPAGKKHPRASEYRPGRTASSPSGFCWLPFGSAGNGTTPRSFEAPTPLADVPLTTKTRPFWVGRGSIVRSAVHGTWSPSQRATIIRSPVHAPSSMFTVPDDCLLKLYKQHFLQPINSYNYCNVVFFCKSIHNMWCLIKESFISAIT